MLISASRRTDIPAFYSEWFMNRINAGFCLVRNPMNAAQIRRVSLTPDDVDGIVFWTKNAAPILTALERLDVYAYYFQYTVTAYDADIERGLPSKRGVVIPSFLELSRRIGARRVIWRYDPILFSPKYTFDYHIRAFSRLCELLAGYTERVVISFLLEYKSVSRSIASVGAYRPPPEERLTLAAKLQAIAANYGITVTACCEEELHSIGIPSAVCVDGGLIERLSGRTLAVQKDKNQRPTCRCSQSVDIGKYNTCANGCLYCYATHSAELLKRNAAAHDPNGEFLIERRQEITG